MPGFRFTEDEVWEQIAAAHTALHTTLRKDGRPITLPIWFATIDRAIYVGTPVAAKKLLRIANDPRGHFVVETGLKWGELAAITFAVTASVVDDADLAARAQAAIDEKYAGFGPELDRLPAAVGEHYAERRIVQLVPDGRLNSWNNRALMGDDSQPDWNG